MSSRDDQEVMECLKGVILFHIYIFIIEVSPSIYLTRINISLRRGKTSSKLKWSLFPYSLHHPVIQSFIDMSHVIKWRVTSSSSSTTRRERYNQYKSSSTSSSFMFRYGNNPVLHTLRLIQSQFLLSVSIDVVNTCVLGVLHLGRVVYLKRKGLNDVKEKIDSPFQGFLTIFSQLFFFLSDANLVHC